jgi:hypothetical protein
MPAGLHSFADRKPGRQFLAAAFFVLLLPSINFMLHSLQTLRFPNEYFVREKVKNAQGLILTDNPRFAWLSRNALMIDPFPMSYLEKRGKWNSAELIDMLKEGKIEMVVLTLPVENALGWQGFKRIPASVLTAIQKYYQYKGTLDGYHIYMKKSSG